MYHYLLGGSQLHTIIYLFLISIQIIRHHSNIFKPCFALLTFPPFFSLSFSNLLQLLFLF